MVQSNHPIGVGLIGYGFVGKTFHAPLIGAVEGLDLCAVVSGDASKVHADLPDVTIYPETKAMLADPAIELVVIATPNETHAPLAKAALAAGKHVVLDKPFALDLTEARAVTQLAVDANRLLCVFHNRRWDSDYLTVSAAVEAGTIGDVVHFESHIDRFRPDVRDRWRERAGPGAGIWFDLGPHLIDQALQLFGLPDRVLASLAAQRSGAQIDDWAHVILSYGRRRVILHASMLVAGGTHRFVVQGTRGTLVKHAADPQESQLLAGMTPGTVGWGEDPDPLVVHDGVGASREQPSLRGDQRQFYVAMAAALAGSGPPPVSMLEALAVMAVLDAAKRSSDDGKAIELPLCSEERVQWR
ncbi:MULTISPECIES: oxidoreductase [unclassified Sphingomonas]|uniref:oxidoreductase n=1 Tax=unclassified Sphingomonas TaxID=196159 RepID=UPI00226A0748